MDKIVPPDHIRSNHIYSNAYRYSLALGHDLDAARLRAREAAEEFRTQGHVAADYVKGFRGPNAKKSPKGDSGVKGPKPKAKSKPKGKAKAKAKTKK